MLREKQYQAPRDFHQRELIGGPPWLDTMAGFYDNAFADMTETKTWMCLICGWIYDEAAGSPEHGIAPGTAWADVPMNWTCPECGARKEDFEMVQI